VGETERKREREAERKDRTQVSYVADIKLYSMSWQLEDRVKSIGKRNKVRTNKRVKRCETEMEMGKGSIHGNGKENWQLGEGATVVSINQKMRRKSE